MNEVTLYKPNELIGAIDQIEVSRTAKHLLNYLLQYAQMELHKALKNKEEHGNKFEVSVNQINGLAEFQKHDYERLKKTLITLMQPIVLRDDPKNFKAIVPIYEIRVDIDKGLYVFSIADTVRELLQSCDYFTKLPLKEFNYLESKHSIVVYEWLKRYETSPQIPQITVEDLRNMTHTTDKKAYNNFTNFQTYVLDVAVNEISEKTPYTVTYEPIKTRTKYRPKVTAIKFTMTKKKSAEQLAVTSGIESYVRGRYQSLCDKYIQFNFCSTKEEFYEATYAIDYELLFGFFERKKDIQHKDKLQWLYATLEDPSSKLHYRRPNQQDYYKRLFDKEDRLTQGLLVENQKTQGFLEQVLQLQKRHNDKKKIDIETWL